MAQELMTAAPPALAASDPDRGSGPVDTPNGAYAQLFAYAVDLQAALCARQVAFEQLYAYARDLQRAILERDDARIGSEAAERTKTALLANMSHEFRTPLTTVLGFAQLLKRRETEPERRLLLGYIADAARDAEALASRMLTMAQLASEDRRRHLETCAVPAIVGAAIERIRGAARRRGLSLHSDIPAEGCLPVILDRVKLSQALDLLLDNAIKFTPSGHVAVRLETVGRTGLPGWIVIEDTGVGVDPAYERELFTAFSQQDMSATRAFEGAGLGLATARSLLRATGCALSFERPCGGGARFRIAFAHTAADGRTTAGGADQWDGMPPADQAQPDHEQQQPVPLS